jgi:ketosteroid isomerase-like protein
VRAGIEIEALERNGWEALSGPNGAAFYEATMHEDGLMVFPGMVMTKAEALAAIRAAPPWRRFELSDVRAVEAGDVALVAYTATAERQQGTTYTATMTSVYVLSHGRWQLLLHQQSPET